MVVLLPLTEQSQAEEEEEGEEVGYIERELNGEVSVLRTAFFHTNNDNSAAGDVCWTDVGAHVRSHVFEFR